MQIISSDRSLRRSLRFMNNRREEKGIQLSREISERISKKCLNPSLLKKKNDPQAKETRNKCQCVLDLFLVLQALKFTLVPIPERDPTNVPYVLNHILGLPHSKFTLVITKEKNRFIA